MRCLFHSFCLCQCVSSYHAHKLKLRYIGPDTLSTCKRVLLIFIFQHVYLCPGSSRNRPNKSKWVDSTKSTSFAEESEAFIEYGQKKEDDAVSINEGGDLEMKLKIIDEATEGNDKPVAVANTSFEASTSAEGVLDAEEKDDEDKQEADPCDVDEEQAKDPVMPTITATTSGVQSDNKADNGNNTGSSEDN